jgi:hypothetical protein
LVITANPMICMRFRVSSANRPCPRWAFSGRPSNVQTSAGTHPPPADRRPPSWSKRDLLFIETEFPQRSLSLALQGPWKHLASVPDCHEEIWVASNWQNRGNVAREGPGPKGAGPDRAS